MALTKAHLRDVCMLNGGTSGQYHLQCRYLATDDNDWTKHMCAKKVKKEADIIDIEVSKFIADCKKNGQDPKKQNRAIGDNCAGYTYFRYKKQGYDVDGMNAPIRQTKP